MKMGPGPRMTLERRYEALSWRGKLSEAAIARKLGVARRTIQCLFKKYEETRSAADKKGRGRKRLTTQQEDRMLIRKSLYNRRATSRQLAEEMQKMTGKQLSTTTVKTRLLEAAPYSPKPEEAAALGPCPQDMDRAAVADSDVH
ncbi:N-acetyltransferase 6 [Octopus vulgaris]|uniref:N-acetyltransferase 6 n=2 Tax=Octopus vulgaris TaxID=6645 RepID=A0AA36F797_OCTVU|nr:N-acetyltransferase 6 [Octopus vulgaris]